MKHVFLFLQPPLYQGMICPLSSPGKKAHNFNTDHSSNSLLDQWKKFHSLSLFIHIIHYLWIFLQRGNELDQQVSKHGPMSTQFSKTICGAKKRVCGLRSLWNSALWISVTSSTMHFSITKAVRSSVVKNKPLPLCSIQIYPSYLIIELFVLL